MFDVDKFIDCVHGKPALWEKGSKEHSDKICRERAWVDIGEIMYENWLNFELADKDDKVREMKNKWRHIRDNFLKFVNHGKSGATTKKRRYIYADALGFLLNVVDKKKTPSTAENIVENEEEDEETEMEISREQYVDEKILALNISNFEPSTSEQPDIAPLTDFRQPSMSNLTPFQKELLRKLGNRSKKEEDADKSFLLSLLPDFKKLNDEEKLDFKFTILQFFRDIQQKKSFHNVPPHPFTMNSSYQFQEPPFPVRITSPNLKPSPIHLKTSVYNSVKSPQNSLQSSDSQTSTYE